MAGMKNRIVFGTIMVVATVALLWLDWHLEQQEMPIIVHERTVSLPLPDAPGEDLVRTVEIPSVVTGLPLGVVTLLLVAVGYFEIARMIRSVGTQPLGVTGPLGAAVLATCPVWLQLLPGLRVGGGMLWVPALLLPAVMIEQMTAARTHDAIRRVGCTLLAIAYLGLGGAMILAIRIHYGVPMLVLFLTAVKFADIGAYFTGKTWGKHKLIPWLSPGKSWEGLIGGLVASALVATGIVWLFGTEQTFALWKAPLFGLAMCLAGQFADLCESLLKRSADVKDSGALVPNFGGVLDIMDSPLIAAPMALVLLAFLA
jgi:phosphatidate cytidylyltransferase